MTERELKRMSRTEILELLLSQTNRIEELEEKLNEAATKAQEATKQMQDRQLKIEQAGSIAEASLQLSGIFNDAQAAADQYLENIKRIEEDTKKQSDKLLADTRVQCDEMIAKAKRESEEYWDDVSKKLEDFCSSYTGLKDLLSLKIPSWKDN